MATMTLDQRFANLDAWAIGILMACAVAFCPISNAAEAPAGSSVSLFNGKDFEGWYTYTTETKFENPGVFQAVDGEIYVPGGKGETAYYGGLVTKQSYENYRLRFEYRWGKATYGDRKDKARDAGVLLHCIGPNPPGPWMTSYEFQIIEGGTGDLLLVNTGQGDDSGRLVSVRCTAAIEVRGNAEPYFKPDGQPRTFEDAGRINWWGRAPDWKDASGFRGPNDVESPADQWTRCEAIARGDALEFYVNEKLVNRAERLSHRKGRIFFQTEGAEVWYRRIELTPLDK